MSNFLVTLFLRLLLKRLAEIILNLSTVQGLLRLNEALGPLGIEFRSKWINFLGVG